jgi:hypothetical protein
MTSVIGTPRLIWIEIQRCRSWCGLWYAAIFERRQAQHEAQRET